MVVQKPTLPGCHRDLPYGWTRCGAGQAGDVYESERLAVSALVREFDRPSADLLVIYDELDLTLGTFKDQRARITGRAQRSPQAYQCSWQPGMVASADRGWA